MTHDKYIGLDVHQATISIAVLDSGGKLVMESVIETKARTVLQFFQGLRGDLYVTFEEGTSAAWLYDLLKPHATKVVVCDPRKNALLRSGSKDDRIDARKLATLLRGGLLSTVYHGENGVSTLKELARSYLAITKELTSTMNRLKALYRSRAIPCAGKLVYAPRHRAEWLTQLPEAGVRLRAQRLYQQLDMLQDLRASKPGGISWRRAASIAPPNPTRYSLHRSDPNGSSDRAGANAPSLSCQVVTVGLLRTGLGDAHERRVPRRRRAVAAREKTADDLRTEREPQPRSEIHLRERHQREHPSGTVPRFLQRSDREGTQALDGPPHPRAKDCSDRFDSMEKGGALRSRQTETASSLSVASGPDPAFPPIMGRFGSCDVWFEGEYPWES